MTKEELIAQCKAENPIIIENINGEERQLNAAEYELACEKWAEMRLQQIAEEKNQEIQWRTKVSAYEKLGLTPDEIKVLVPTPTWLSNNA